MAILCTELLNIQVSSAVEKFPLNHLTFMKDDTEPIFTKLFPLFERNPKRIFIFIRAGKNENRTFGVCFAGSRSRGSVHLEQREWLLPSSLPGNCTWLSASNHCSFEL